MTYPIKKITVISLVFNNSSLLRTAIESLNSQIVDEDITIEYLIVDDFSTIIDLDFIESSIKTINKKNITPKLILNNSNLGTVSSFNNAIKSSTGDIIIPLSADDSFYDDHVVSDIIKVFNDRKCLLLTGLRVPLSSNIELASLPKRKFIPYFSDPKRLLKHLLIKGNIISGSSTYYHRKVFGIVGFFNQEYRLLEDYPFYLRSLECGVNIEFFDRKLIKYGVTGVSSSEKLHPVLEQDITLLLSKILQSKNLSFYQRRSIYYRRYLNSKDKTTFKNTLIYFDLCLLEVIIKAIRFLKSN